MNRTEKETFVTEFQELLGRAPVFYLTDFTGLDVKSLSELRQSLRDSGAEYVVTKNRLVRLALKGSDLPDLGDALTGPTGFVFGFDDAVGPAKVLTDFAKENKDRPALKLGVVDRKLIQPEQIAQLARLPSREVLLAQLAGALQGPMATLAGALEAKLHEMMGLLEALKDKRGSA
ncbi:MAG TPA: 50S ribosomal protein L10 [Gemmatimonadetes bacterium]|nr:50S ribosomal protein L10 [Gemmatimonadota bacterium]|tara:strand:- start:18 stop:542 length:525 start_codon:yes stop_codon:yes gene_type:complete